MRFSPGHNESRQRMECVQLAATFRKLLSEV